MVDLKEMQKVILDNKKSKFGIHSVDREFCYAHGELCEAFDAYLKQDGSLGEELADVVIYLLGIAELKDINLEEEIIKKVNKNSGREYAKVGEKYVEV